MALAVLLFAGATRAQSTAETEAAPGDEPIAGGAELSGPIVSVRVEPL